MKEAIKTLLLQELSSVYCDTCANSEDENRCDECHRKAMQWSLSEDSADKLASAILDITITPSKS